MSKKGTLDVGKKANDIVLDDKAKTFAWGTKGKFHTIALKPRLTIVQLSTENPNEFIVGPDAKGGFHSFGCKSKDEVITWTNAIKEVIKSVVETSSSAKVDMMGWLKVKGRSRFYELKNGVLVWYQKQQSLDVKLTKNFKGQLMLNGCTAELGDKPNVIVLMDGKNKIQLTAELATQVKPWLKALKKGAEEAEASGVGKDKGKKREQLSVGAKIKKGLAQKVGTSKTGKNMIKKLFNAEVMELLTSLKKVVTAFSNPKKADEIENNLIKIITKLYFLVDEEKVPLEDFLKADKPLRQALKLLSEAWGNWSNNRRRKKGWLEETFGQVAKKIAEVEAVLVRLVSPFIRPKNVVRIEYTLAFIGNPEFLQFVAKNEKLEDDRLELELAMDNYTAIEINPD